MSKIIVLNLGSTSFKYKIFNSENLNVILSSGGVENTSGVHELFDALEKHVGDLNTAGVTAVGYKAVHGGNITGVRFVDEPLIKTMENFSCFAPAHNPVYISFMRHIKDRYPNLPQIAYFETSFHSTIPEHRRLYGVPYAWADELNIRRYGFHGSSHEYIALKMKEYCPGAKRIVSAHLGGSSSICAIKDGKSIASSMGAAPQSGLFHNNRVGDFDVFCLPALIERFGVDKVFDILSKESGFLGLSGISGDLRDIIAAQGGGNKQASLTVDAFVDNITGYIGMFTAYLGGLDAIAFTGGIGFNSQEIRRGVCGMLNIDISDNQEDADSEISVGDGIKVYKIKTNEEFIVAKHIIELLENQ